jgi:hypothetical protein
MQEEGLQFKVRASCVEIYNESVIDLIKSSRFARGASLLPVKFDPSKGSFFVQDISYGKCPTEVELLRLYMKALRNRSVAAHELNRDSSRSHVLFTVYIDSMVKDANGELCPLISSAILRECFPMSLVNTRHKVGASGSTFSWDCTRHFGHSFLVTDETFSRMVSRDLVLSTSFSLVVYSIDYPRRPSHDHIRSHSPAHTNL